MRLGKKIVCIFLLVGLVFSEGLVVRAATRDYTISLSADTVTRGGVVTLYLNGSNSTGSFQVSSSDNTVLSGGTTAWVENSKISIKFEALKAGSATITVKPIDVANSTNAEAITEVKTLTVTVKNPTSSSNSSGGSSNSSSSNTTNSNKTTVTKSNEATLSSLGIEGVALDKDFSKDVLEYNVVLEAGTESVKVSATSSDSKATVSGVGDIKVTDGINKIEVLVTAEDGTTKTYVINATVEVLDPIEVSFGKEDYTVVRKKEDLPVMEYFDDNYVTINEEEVVAYYSEKLKIYLVGLKNSEGDIALYIYDKEKNSYTLYEQIVVGTTTLYLKDNDEVFEGFSRYEVSINEVLTEILKIDKDSQFGLIYGVNVATGREGFYVYDAVEETLSRYFEEATTFYKKKANTYFIILMIGAGVVVGGAIIGGIMLMKNKKKRKRKYV